MNNIAVVANRLLDEFFDDSIFVRNILDPSSMFNNIYSKKMEYPVDIFREKNGALRLEISIIGHDKKDVSISTIDYTLRVKADHPAELDGSPIYRGICRKGFDFEWKLSDHYELDKVVATTKEGLLIIRIPLKKEVEKQPKTVSIA